MAPDLIPLIDAVTNVLRLCPKQSDLNVMRQQLARLEAIEAAAQAVVTDYLAQTDGIVTLWTVRVPIHTEVLDALMAALVAGAGATTEGEDI